MSLDTARTRATLIVSYDKLSRILIAGHCRCTFFGHATPDRAGARPYRVQCRVARCDMGLPAHTSHPLSRLFACFAGPFLRQSGALRLHGLRGTCEHATPVFRLADTASLVVAATPRCYLLFKHFLAPFCYFGIATTLFRVAICAPCFFDRHFCYLLPSRLH